MDVWINDSLVTCSDDITLLQLLREQDVLMTNIAVAKDGTIVPKGEWGNVKLNADCKIIVIRAVQGG